MTWPQLNTKSKVMSNLHIFVPLLMLSDTICFFLRNWNSKLLSFQNARGIDVDHGLPDELMAIHFGPFTRFWSKWLADEHWWTIVSVWFLLYPSSIISDGQKSDHNFRQKPLGVEISCGGLGEAFRLWPQGWAWGPFLWSLRALADSICSGWVAL